MESEIQLAFDYDGLDIETRVVVQQRTTEIRTLMRRAAQDIIDIGQRLIEVKERLPHGAFGPWLRAEFEWHENTALNFIRVAQRFGEHTHKICEFAPSALYLLAAPSTPDAARDEALSRAAGGEHITHATAKEIVEGYKQLPPDCDNSNDGDDGDETGTDVERSSSPAPIATPSEPVWTPREKKLRAALEAGRTVVVNMNTDKAVVKWAQGREIYARIDRATEWGNPYVLGDDGERGEVIAGYVVYFARKKKLNQRVCELVGMALGCHCAPLPCHGDHLAQLANKESE